MKKGWHALALTGCSLLILVAVLPIAITAFTSFATAEWVNTHYLGRQRAFFTPDMVLGFSQYKAMLGSTAIFARPLLISLLYAALATIAQIVISFFAAYCFAKVPMRKGKGLFFGYLVAMLMPAQVILLPSFILMHMMGLLDTWLGLWLPAAFAPFGVFFLRQALASVPNEVIEAGVIDTGNVLKLSFRVILPSIRAAVVALGAITFAEVWNAVEPPMILLTYPNQPAAVVIAYAMNQRQAGQVFAMCAIMLLPVLLLFLALRKHIFAAMENMRF